jgi:hypothetical protein
MAELVVIEPEDEGEGLEAMLDRLLGRVRAGEISSIAVAYVGRDGRAGSMWSEAPSFAAQLGAVHRLAHQLQLERDEADDAAAG